MENVIVIGATGFKPTTVQAYHDKVRFTNSQRLKMLTIQSHESWFVASGNSTKGDRETTAEYQKRVSDWVDNQIHMQTAQAVARASSDAPANEAAFRKRFRDNMAPVRSADDPVCIRRAAKERRVAVGTGTTVDAGVAAAPFSSTV